MRIAMISEHASPLACLGGVDAGGQNVYVGQLAKHLARRGWEIDIFTRRDDGTLPQEVSWCPGGRVIQVPAGPARVIRKEELLPFMGKFAEFVQRFSQKRGGYDLAHGNFFMSALVAANLKKAMHLPFLVTFHALGKVRRLHQGDADTFPAERTAIEERVVREADAVIAECPQDEKDLVDFYAASPRKLRTIPCGFDPAEFSPMPQAEARRAIGIDEKQPVILQLGRMVPRKGVDNVIRGVARLLHRHALRARLLIVGGETRNPDPQATPEIGRLARIAQDEGIADSVTFVGSRGRRELRAYFAASDVFVTTPWYEPFGITPVEAMACGIPVVGAAVGGIQSTVVDGQTGYLVPPRDPDTLADRLAHLLREPGLRTAMGLSALRRANQHFTWARVADQVAEVYQEITRSARKGSHWPSALVKAVTPRLAADC